jgi:hypothetical protein
VSAQLHPNRKLVESQIEPTVDEPSVAATLSQIGADMQRLAQQEIQLAKAELNGWVQEGKKTVLRLAVGSWLLVTGSIVLCVACIRVLEAIGFGSATATMLVAILWIGVGLLLTMRVPSADNRRGPTQIPSSPPNEGVL